MIEIDKIQNINQITSIIIDSLNDWPNEVKNLLDFEKQISEFIDAETTLKNISKSLCEIDFSKNSWQAESLTQLVELFSYFEKGQGLKYIFNNILKGNNELLERS